jgi:protein gp37
MSEHSGIEWTDATWNPVTGCTKVSPGCAHCYIEDTPPMRKDGRRFVKGELPLRFHPDRLEKPLHWRRPRMVFVNSMSDLFHEDIPDYFVNRVFRVMALAPQHTFQVLTKRPERMLDVVSRVVYDGKAGDGWHPIMPNVWLGVTIENRRYVDRADLLRQTPAAVRFISAEPLLGRLIPHWTRYGDCWSDGSPADGCGLDLTGIDWLIVGGESGPKHRPMRPEWVRDLRDACRCTTCWGHGRLCSDDGLNMDCVRCGKRGTTTAFFFKQWGGRTPKSGGRELDGRTWDEFPTVVHRHPVAA